MENMLWSKRKEGDFSGNIWINWSEGGRKALKVEGRIGCCASNGAWSFCSAEVLAALREGVSNGFSRRLASRRYPWRQNELREKLLMVSKETGGGSLV